MLLALLVASISDISIIQCPCSFKTPGHHPAFSGHRRTTRPGSPAGGRSWTCQPLTAHQTEHFLIFGAGAEYPPDSPQQEVFQHFLHIVALVRTQEVMETGADAGRPVPDKAVQHVLYGMVAVFIRHDRERRCHLFSRWSGHSSAQNREADTSRLYPSGHWYSCASPNPAQCPPGQSGGSGGSPHAGEGHGRTPSGSCRWCWRAGPSR